MNESIHEFLIALSSKAPTPGGGGASALIGAIGASLGSMVANLTSGKKKYAAFQPDIERILGETAVLRDEMEALIARDAEAFAPLAAAYGIPKDAPGRDETLEAALHAAAEVPLDIVKTVCKVLPILEELMEKGSKLAISDVGVAAAACRAAAQGAALNVYINTKLMKDREFAVKLDEQTDALTKDAVERCDAVYAKVCAGLRR